MGTVFQTCHDGERARSDVASSDALAELSGQLLGVLWCARRKEPVDRREPICETVELSEGGDIGEAHGSDEEGFFWR